MATNRRPARGTGAAADKPGATGPTLGGAEWFRMIGAVLRRPGLWWTAARQWARLVPAHWWRESPHLPVPPRAYLEFRLETAYGQGGHPVASDIIEYLRWCRHANPPGPASARR